MSAFGGKADVATLRQSSRRLFGLGSLKAEPCGGASSRRCAGPRLSNDIGEIALGVVNEGWSRFSGGTIPPGVT